MFITFGGGGGVLWVWGVFLGGGLFFVLWVWGFIIRKYPVLFILVISCLDMELGATLI